MTFYFVDYWSPVSGPSRAHFPAKQPALKFARALIRDRATETLVTVSRQVMNTTKANVLRALDAAACIGGDGGTWYPGDSEKIVSFEIIEEPPE